jgi:hypothetical protein
LASAGGKDECVAIFDIQLIRVPGIDIHIAHYLFEVEMGRDKPTVICEAQPASW